LVPLKAASHRSQALCLFIKRVNFLVEPRHLRFWRIGAAQLFERLADGEFSCFSNGRILYIREMDAVRPLYCAIRISAVSLLGIGFFIWPFSGAG
jgi:hypothetical protein